MIGKSTNKSTLLTSGDVFKVSHLVSSADQHEESVKDLRS